MKKPLSTFFFCLLFLCTAPPAGADGITADLSTGVEVMRGDTTYQIGGSVLSRTGGAYTLHFPVSELEFPLDLLLFSLGTTVNLGNRLSLCLSGKVNLDHDPGKIEDSDWLTSPVTLDIYSESESRADALLVSAGLRYRIYSVHEVALLAGAGCRYQVFSFDTASTLQYYPDSGAPGDFLAGQALAYEITYLIPYAEIAMAFAPGKKTAVEFALGYSPWITATDEDRHLLKNRVTECDYRGDAFMTTMKARHDITERLSAALQCEIMMIQGDGEAITREGGAWSHTIDQTTESRQTSLGISAGYRF